MSEAYAETSVGEKPEALNGASAPAHDTSLWPIFAQSLAKLIGCDAVVALSRRFGGRELYVPKSATAHHPITVAVGLEAAKVLSREHGRTKIIIPTFGRQGKKSRILDILASHKGEPLSTAKIAEMVGSTQRYVKMVLCDYAPDRKSLKGGGQFKPNTVMYKARQLLKSSNGELLAEDLAEAIGCTVQQAAQARIGLKYPSPHRRITKAGKGLFKPGSLRDRIRVLLEGSAGGLLAEELAEQAGCTVQQAATARGSLGYPAPHRRFCKRAAPKPTDRSGRSIGVAAPKRRTSASAPKPTDRPGRGKGVSTPPPRRHTQP